MLANFADSNVNGAFYGSTAGLLQSPLIRNGIDIEEKSFFDVPIQIPKDEKQDKTQISKGRKQGGSANAVHHTTTTHTASVIEMTRDDGQKNSGTEADNKNKTDEENEDGKNTDLRASVDRLAQRFESNGRHQHVNGHHKRA